MRRRIRGGGEYGPVVLLGVVSAIAVIGLVAIAVFASSTPRRKGQTSSRCVVPLSKVSTVFVAVPKATDDAGRQKTSWRAFVDADYLVLRAVLHQRSGGLFDIHGPDGRPLTASPVRFDSFGDVTSQQRLELAGQRRRAIRESDGVDIGSGLDGWNDPLVAWSATRFVPSNEVVRAVDAAGNDVDLPRIVCERLKKDASKAAGRRFSMYVPACR
jgi:hypothetical protein